MPALADDGGVGDHLDRARGGEGGVDPVVLDADQVREGRPGRHSGALEGPVVRRGDHVRGVHRVAVVDDPEHRALRVGARADPEVGGRRGTCLVARVLRPGVLVADHRTVRPEVGGLEADPAEAAVGAEDRQVRPGVAGRDHVGALFGGPVLVVAERQHGARPVQQSRVAGHVDPGGVGERQPELLGQGDQRRLVDQEQSGAVVVAVRPVEDDPQRAGGQRAGRAVVEAVAAPLVVGLPGRGGAHDHGPAGGARRADGEGDVAAAGAVLCVQAQQVGALGPARGVHGEGALPAGQHGAGGLVHMRGGLPGTGDVLAAPDQPGPGAVVPAHPVGGDGEGGGGGGDVQAEGLAGQHADPVGEALDGAGPAGVGDLPVGVAGAGLLVLGVALEAGVLGVGGSGGAGCGQRRGVRVSAAAGGDGGRHQAQAEDPPPSRFRHRCLPVAPLPHPWVRQPAESMRADMFTPFEKVPGTAAPESLITAGRRRHPGGPYGRTPACRPVRLPGGRGPVT